MAIFREADGVTRARDGGGERGMTLLELLIALSIFAALASLSGVALSGTLSHLRHEHAAEQLVSDLRRASLLARTRGLETQVHAVSDGYSVPALEIERVWPRDVTAIWQLREAGRWHLATNITLTPRATASPELHVEISRAGERVSVRIEPVTGRIHAE